MFFFRFSHTGVKNYKCSECDKSFMYAEGLLKHKQLHELGNMRKCSTCKQHFGTPKELKEHTLVSTVNVLHKSVLVEFLHREMGQKQSSPDVLLLPNCF